MKISKAKIRISIEFSIIKQTMWKSACPQSQIKNIKVNFLLRSILFCCTIVWLAKTIINAQLTNCTPLIQAKFLCAWTDFLNFVFRPCFDKLWPNICFYAQCRFHASTLRWQANLNKDFIATMFRILVTYKMISQNFCFQNFCNFLVNDALRCVCCRIWCYMLLSKKRWKILKNIFWIAIASHKWR